MTGGRAQSPLASVIIPTHDRASTLALSVQSALEQTVRDIEIVIVGDGCTEQCRRIAREFAARDERVLFRDLPKGRLRGVENRDLAVREAKGELIFYNDDDDLLLPHHVAVLSRELRHVDIADTPPVSIAPSGQVDLGLHDSSHSVHRRLLAAGQLKTIFDTHLGHRKDAYMALGSPWLRATDWNVTMRMFGAFATDTRVRWRSVQRITALSFHGRRRITMSAEERTRELADWRRRSKGPLLEARLRRSGTYSFHALRVVRAFAKAGASRDETQAYLAPLLLAASGPFGASARQRRGIEAVLTLVFGGQLTDAGTRETLAVLLDARLGPEFSAVQEVINLLRGRADADRLLCFLGNQAITPVSAFAGLCLRLPARLTDPDLMNAMRAVFDEAPSETKFHFAVAVAGVLFEAREASLSWEWVERAAPLAPQSIHSSGFWRLRVGVARALGFIESAEEASVQLAQRSALED